jgi:hypothetical protein
MQWWRMQGTVLAVIPADECLEVGMMVGDFEAKPAQRMSGIRDVRPFRRPGVDIMLSNGGTASVETAREFPILPGRSGEPLTSSEYEVARVVRDVYGVDTETTGRLREEATPPSKKRESYS